MAEVWRDAHLEIDSLDVSAFIKSLTLDYGVNALDDTVMGDEAESVMAGLKRWSVTVQLTQDFTDSGLDETLFALVGSATPATLTMRKSKTDSVSATNPSYIGDAVLESYPPFGGGVGEALLTSITFRAAGTLARSESA